MMSGRLEGLTTIQSLPQEVRGRIFNLFPQRDTLTLRLVCKQWNHDVNEQYDFKVNNLDETSEDFERQCHLRIRHLGIHRLKETTVVQPDGTIVLRFPKIITSLKILNSPNSSVSPSNVQSLLGLVDKALVFLEIQMSVWIFDDTFRLDSHSAYNFQKLTDLRLEVCVKDASTMDQGLLSALQNSAMPNLKHFWARLHGSWEASMEEAILISCYVLTIAAKSGPGLETLCLCQGNMTTEDPGICPIGNQAAFGYLNSLKNLKRVSTNLLLFLPGNHGIWKDILARQTNLVDLNYSGGSPIMTVSFDLAQTIVASNYRTLTSVTLGWIVYPTQGPGLDLAIFGTCQSLQKLSLFGRICERFAVRIEEPSYVNFHRLPSNLKYLSISCAQLLASEVLKALKNGFRSLEVLALSNPWGVHQRVQFSSKIFAKILSSGSLLEVDVKIMIPGKLRIQQRKYSAILNKFMAEGYKYPAGGLDKRLKVVRASIKDRWEIGTGILDGLYDSRQNFVNI